MKIFSKLKGLIEQHVAGATVSHGSPFENFDIYLNDDELTKKEIDEWVLPFYMSTLGMDLDPGFVEAERKITDRQISRLLGDFNWRTRSVGAVFCFLRNSTSHEKQISNLLLKSEVCYSGSTYCYTLAGFNNSNSVTVLSQYLDYYLRQKELYFDQSDAMSALKYLDSVNGTGFHLNFVPLWAEFVANKQNWDLDRSYAFFTKNIEKLQALRSESNI